MGASWKPWAYHEPSCGSAMPWRGEDCGVQCRATERCASEAARSRPSVRHSGCTSSKTMTFDYALGTVLSVLLTAYLAYALIKPERF